ncbi:hypothetical protein ACFSTC_11745 [Nonomuraea ferruginea]
MEAHDESAEVTAEDDTDIDTDGDADTSDDQEETGGRRRRRRRGGRGRGKSRERDENDEGDDSDDSDEEGQEEASEESQDEAGSSSRRRRRRRRRGADDDTADTTPDDPPNTVVRIRAPRSGRAAAHDTSADGVQSVRGSTRLEAKKQRRREGRELGHAASADHHRVGVPGPPRVRRPDDGGAPPGRPHADRGAGGRHPRRALRQPRGQPVLRRQRLPRQGAERAAVDGGRVRRRRQGAQRRPVRGRGQLRHRSAWRGSPSGSSRR